MDLSMNMAMLSSLTGKDVSVSSTGTDSYGYLKELGGSSSSSGLSFQSMLTNLINNNLINGDNLSQLKKMINQDVLLNQNIFSDMLMSESGTMEKLTDINQPKEDGKDLDLLDLILCMKGQNVTEIISAIQSGMNVNMDSKQLLQEQGKMVQGSSQTQNVIQGVQQNFQSSKNSHTTDLGFVQAKGGQTGEEEVTLKNYEQAGEQDSVLGKIKSANLDNQVNDYSPANKFAINTSETDMALENSVNVTKMANTIKEGITQDSVEQNVSSWSQLQEESETMKNKISGEKENKKPENGGITDLSSQMSDVRGNTVQSSSNIAKGVEQIEPYSQIGKEIMAKLDQKLPMEFRMQLQPENLGKIDVSLKMTDGKLVIDIMAASTQTQTLLAGQVDKLISSLGLQHVQVETVQVNHNQLIQSVPNYLSEADGQQQDYTQGKGQQEFQRNSNASKNQRNMSRTEIESAREASMLLEKMKYETGRMNYVI